jgi:small-conductance mechanosensitive channel
MLGRGHNWPIGIAAGVVTVAALVVGSGHPHLDSHVDRNVLSYSSAAAILIFGVMATARLSAAFARAAVLEWVPSAGGAVRLLSASVGYLFVAFSILAVLDVSVEKLLVGAGLAGVVLGIAAQQSLGNVFAGIVLVISRPFAIGDHVRIRSGALGGLFDAWIVDLSLTYVTLRTDDGILKIPNAGMLAAGVLHLTPTSSPLPPPAPAPAGAPAPAAAASGPAPAGAPAPSSAASGPAPAGSPAPAGPEQPEER